MRAFIVDDSAIVRVRLAEMRLRDLQVAVVGQAGTVAAALEEIHRLQPECVLLDIHPNGDGISVLKAGADFFLDQSKQFDAIPDLLRTLRAEIEGPHE